MIENFTFVKEILDNYQINEKFWKLSPKYYDAYINKICGDYLFENSEAFKNSRFSWVRSFFLHSVFILLGAFVSVLKSYRYLKVPKTINADAQIIACPFCGRYVWFKHLSRLIDSPIRVVYHPLFHYDYFKQNVDAYDKQTVSPEFYRFGLWDILKGFVTLLYSFKRSNCCAKELDDIFGVYTGKFSRIFLFPILYGGFIKRFVKGNKFGEKRIVWLFDYDYDYKYIVFNNIIHQLRNNDITFHLQHGSFVTYNPAYCNPVCDYSLCCSKREQKIILGNNAFDSKIRVLGAPLQTFDDVDITEKPNKFWDILCLLTEADDLGYEPMKNVLRQLDRDSFKIRIRYRPASKNEDKKKLEAFVSGMEESVGKTLLEDVLISKVVICFSEDALYTAIRNGNPIVYVRNVNIAQYYDVSEQSSYFYIINDNDFPSVPISYMVSNYKDCDFIRDNCVINNFGYYRLEEIKAQINIILSNI